MKIIVMTDLEGTAGVTNARDYIYPASKYYEDACELATLEVSAAVQGALEAGATEVLVVDGHGPGAMKRQLLHPRAKLLTGRPWVGNTTAQGWGCDGSFAAAMSIGQHGMSNTDGGHLAHTGSFAIEKQEINGIETGELAMWMLTTGVFDVPLVMVSGDEACCCEARALIPNVEIVAVKWGCKRGSAAGLTEAENQIFNCVATHRSPDEVRELIREHAYRAVRRIPEIVPFRLQPPYTLKVVMRPRESGDKPSTVTVKSADMLDLIFVQRPKAIEKARQARDTDKARTPRIRKKAALKKPVRGRVPSKVAAKKKAVKKPAKKRATARRTSKKVAPRKKSRNVPARKKKRA
jgi:D-amino peptidase